MEPETAPINVIEITGGSDVMGAREAARALIEARKPKTEQAPPDGTAETPSGESQETSTAETQPTGEATEATDAAPEPSIDPPKSWTKEAKERFASLPRETQEYLASREDERDRDFNRRQTEVIEQRKAMEAERGKVDQARQQYETALPALLAALQEQQAGEFADVRTIADVEKMAREDWPRYVMWDAAQKKLAAVQQQVQTATQRQAQEKQTRLGEFVKRETELFADKVPEAKDPAKFQQLQTAAVETLRDLGFTDQDLGEYWRGEKEISLHDHRLQLLIRDGVRYREAQAAAKKASAKPVPPVQRPGTARPRGADAAQAVENLTKRLDQSGSLKDAARLIAARRKAG